LIQGAKTSADIPSSFHQSGPSAGRRRGVETQNPPATYDFQSRPVLCHSVLTHIHGGDGILSVTCHQGTAQQAAHNTQL
jgi:hypothetical protein